MAGWEIHVTALKTIWRRRRWYGWQTREMTQADVVRHLDDIGLGPKLRSFAAELRADKARLEMQMQAREFSVEPRAVLKSTGFPSCNGTGHAGAI